MASNIYIMISNSSKITVRKQLRDNFMVGGQDNMRNSIKGLQLGRLRTTGLEDIPRRKDLGTELHPLRHRGVIPAPGTDLALCGCFKTILAPDSNSSPAAL